MIEEVFICRLCGDCCRGQGGIYIQPAEVEGLAGLLGLTPAEFRERYTEPRYGLLSIKTDQDGYCLFLDQERRCCRVHEIKPAMCRDWPFFAGILASRQGFEEAKSACPGIRPEATWEDFKAYHQEKIKTQPPVTYIPILKLSSAPEEE